MDIFLLRRNKDSDGERLPKVLGLSQSPSRPRSNNLEEPPSVLSSTNLRWPTLRLNLSSATVVGRFHWCDFFSTTARDRSSRPQLSAAGGRSPSPDHLLQSRRQIRNLLRALSPPIPNSRAVVAGSQRLSPSFSATVFEPSSLPCGPVGRTGAPPASCPRLQTCSTPRCRRGCRLGKAWAAQAAAGTSAALGMGARRGLPAPARRVL
jgi:hypothetical protein